MALSLAEKKALLRKKMLEKKQKTSAVQVAEIPSDFKKQTYDMFALGNSPDLQEIKQFSAWVDKAQENALYAFESPRQHEQKEQIELIREDGKELTMVNFSSYNYLGYGYHPEVKKASQAAIERYGTGAASSPVISGTFQLHDDFEKSLIDFMGFSTKTHGISLFSSGYAVNTGTISSFMKPGSYIILDETAHASLMEGAALSGAQMRLFKHNDMEDLERILKTIEKDKVRKLICIEGVYSADGDRGNIKGVVELAKRYDAFSLVDEAHSIMIAGENGRGVAEEQGVLDQVDLFIITFSKAFCSVGGTLIARKEITRYVNWYARSRMFSAAIPPAIIGAAHKALELGRSADGDARRKRIRENVTLIRELLQDKVNLLNTTSWIVPVVYGDETKTLELSDWLQRNGLDGQPMNFPAVPKGEARIRLFVTSEHTKEQIEYAAKVLIEAAEKFDFLSH
ncbi:aminotransferase class I/II-fold pyridoxal phosphate-dependent enzyme [bacterium]|nr:aminotransferase class I/II-fold pyridoxal phosphate-dependent enzyme [bacterium]